MLATTLYPYHANAGADYPNRTDDLPLTRPNQIGLYAA
jgi:hypothetical protein